MGGLLDFSVYLSPLLREKISGLGLRDGLRGFERVEREKGGEERERTYEREERR